MKMNLFEVIFSEDRLERTAVLYARRQISYGELRDQTRRVARILHRLRVAQGDRVALLLNDSPEFVAVFIAICSSGAIAVPINTALRLEEQQAILNDCTARVAFIEADLCDSLSGATGRLPHLQQIVLIDRDASAGESSAANREPPREDENSEELKIWSFGKLMAQAYVGDGDSHARRSALPI